MKDRSRVIFGNEMSNRVYKKALKSKKKNLKKFGDDSKVDYKICLKKNPVIGDMLGVSDVLLNDEKSKEEFDRQKGIIVGNIRMGFGHYRISMAMASAAKALGYKPYWMDLNGYPQTTCTKLISAQNDLYSLGSRLSKNPIFNKLVWEPMNYEGFRKLSYNSTDQKNAELMAPVYKNVPKDIPVVGTHVWPAQAAIHAGMKYVVNAIPDNWPMALHLAEGSVHTIQCRNSYMGYRILNGFNKDKVCKPMPKESLVYTGHYIDHELVSNIEKDCEQRINRKKNNKPMRFLLTIGGAGAQQEIFIAIIKELLPKIREKKVTLFVNVGDYEKVWHSMLKEIPQMKNISVEHFNDWNETKEFSEQLLDEQKNIYGIHSFSHKNIFEAVYCTNLLMRGIDVLITKPSELAFYPVPKLFIKRVGKHEMWGAIHSSEIGDGTLECRDIPHTVQMLNLFLEDNQLLIDMCENIKTNKKIGLYDGAYNVIKLAMGMKK
ncbi:DUF6937 domain-containing protein [Lachnobacterium bovis]|uniref:Glycosyl transferase family 28 C-terminal domain-containing protein n=1 Tax=Lachnobacterium bovis TaxID=140626 RepID=A0A1H9TVD3_9FIRM|nr:hypothetical protein [Lachnobacterium bovis]SES01330.1 hypothetical protein SAMN02910429_01802 [Lachnobacterium bovis]